MSNVMKSYDLETIVHRRHEEVVVSRWGRMPFHPPSATSDVCLSKRLEWPPGIKQSDGGVVTTNGDQMFDVWMALNASHASVKPRHSRFNNDRRHALCP
jgi:hypothetical protein